MTPRGPSAGSRRVRPLVTRTGLLGVVLLRVRAILTGRPCQDRPPAKADTPSSVRRTGPAGHRSSSSAPTHLSALLAVDLAVSRCPSHGRFRSCLRPPQFCRAGTARAGWPAPGQGARHTDPEALTSLQPRPIEEPRGLGLPGAARRPRLFGRFGLVLPGRGSPVILALFPRHSPWLLLGKVGAWLRHHSYRLIR